MRQLAWAAHSLRRFSGFSQAFLSPCGQSREKCIVVSEGNFQCNLFSADGEGEDPDGDVGDGFDSQRQDAIKELSTGSKKVFGGGTKEIKEGSSKGRGRRDRTQPQSVTPGMRMLSIFS